MERRDRDCFIARDCSTGVALMVDRVERICFIGVFFRRRSVAIWRYFSAFVSIFELIVGRMDTFEIPVEDMVKVIGFDFSARFILS